MGLGWELWIHPVPATPKAERLCLQDPTHQPFVLLAPEPQHWENPPEEGELWLGCPDTAPICTVLIPQQDLREGAGQGGQEEGKSPGVEAQITVPVRLVRYRNGSGAEQLCDRTRGEAVGWRREVWGLIDIFRNQHVPQTCW